MVPDMLPYQLFMLIQAELPFKSKPKQMAPRKRQTLEQKRAVVLEPGEKRAVTLVQQLNAIRNAKAAKRQEQQARRRDVSFPLIPWSLVRFIRWHQRNESERTPVTAHNRIRMGSM